MYKFEVDIQKNRLYTTHSGYVDNDDPEKYLADFKFHLKKLKPRFDVISNILEMRQLDEDAMDLIQHTMKLSFEAGMRNVVRVIPASMIGEAKAYSLDKKTVTVGFVPHVVYSLEAANQLLDKLEEESK